MLTEGLGRETGVSARCWRVNAKSWFPPKLCFWLSPIGFVCVFSAPNGVRSRRSRSRRSRSRRSRSRRSRSTRSRSRHFGYPRRRELQAARRDCRCAPAVGHGADHGEWQPLRLVCLNEPHYRTFVCVGVACEYEIVVPAEIVLLAKSHWICVCFSCALRLALAAVALAAVALAAVALAAVALAASLRSRRHLTRGVVVLGIHVCMVCFFLLLICVCVLRGVWRLCGPHLGSHRLACSLADATLDLRVHSVSVGVPSRAGGAAVFGGGKPGVMRTSRGWMLRTTAMRKPSDWNPPSQVSESAKSRSRDLLAVCVFDRARTTCVCGF